MAHGIQDGGIRFVDDAILVHILNVVVEVVGRLARALQIVPEQPVVGRIGFEEIGAAQQGKLFLQE